MCVILCYIKEVIKIKIIEPKGVYRMNYYEIELNHDNGTARIKLLAKSEIEAMNRVCKLENCPMIAITSCRFLRAL